MNRPDRFYMNNCKIAQELYKKEILAMKKQRVDVGNGCLVSYAVKTGSSMTWLEKLLCDAVYTLWLTRRFERQGILRGTVTITVTELLACMSGSGTIRIRQAEPGSISKEQRLADSLERLGQMDIAIWWEEEIERRRLTDVPEVLAGKLLPLRRISGTNRFHLDLDRGLPLYEYASAIHQIIRIPMELLTCGETVLADGSVVPSLKLKNSDTVIQMKHLLLQRCELLRNPKNGFSNRSLRYCYPSHKQAGRLDGLLPIMGIREEDFSTGAWSNKKQAVHKQMKALLDYYCAVGYLTGYHETRDGDGKRSSIIGIDLEGDIRNPESCFHTKKKEEAACMFREKPIE